MHFDKYNTDSCLEFLKRLARHLIVSWASVMIYWPSYSDLEIISLKLFFSILDLSYKKTFNGRDINIFKAS